MPLYGDLFKKMKAFLGEHSGLDQGILTRAKTTAHLLQELDSVLSANQSEFERLREEIGKVDIMLQGEEQKIRSKEDLGVQKKYTLQYIKRLRAQMSNLDRRLTIFDQNIHIHIKLISRVQDMEAMALRGVDEKQIDEVILEFEEEVEKYMSVAHAGEAVSGEPLDLNSKEMRELEELEAEILGKKIEKKDWDKEAPPYENEEEEEDDETEFPQDGFEDDEDEDDEIEFE